MNIGISQGRDEYKHEDEHQDEEQDWIDVQSCFVWPGGDAAIVEIWRCGDKEIWRYGGRCGRTNPIPSMYMYT